ncbi:asparagine synthase-related protein [Saccharothrix australiensis]|uniref:asparagine synthase (glutamine-hydrolyzing) n=1 Tax=Saccharothrix australiensis TaxID=2072 RepID=A0A495W140_9PSEU|nr:asparagine synthase-related protein [Saccharothrix australiensis]RKT54717.1 asparagine synthase (glutamine-hydrolysing) [Saccharothrix australiensis]
MDAGRSATAGHGEEWFVVLPDDECALAVAAALGPGAGPFTVTGRLDHPSGRPWLIGRWDERDLLVGTAGRTRVAVLGCCPAPPDAITALARRATRPADLDRAAGALAGCFHLLATVDGVVRAQGSAFGVRRVFRARAAGSTVAADRADVLALLTGSGVDEARLVSRLMFPAAPPALAGVSLWREVADVPEDHYLLVPPGEPARTVRWWQPPRPTRSLRDGAPALREALVEAVAARTGSGRAVSADLSGGVDSTAVCALAAARVDRLPAFTVVSPDPADDDEHWARVAAAGLPAVRRVVVTDADLPTPYSGILDPGVARDEPYPDIHLRAEDAVRARLLTAQGAELHLTGDGGDEVLHATLAYLPELLRRHPLLGCAHLRGHRALHAWPWSRVARLLAGPRDERSALLAQARALARVGDGDADGGHPDAVHLPAWATPAAVDAARELLRRAALEADPSGRDRALRDSVDLVRHAGRLQRRTSLAAAADGFPVAAPFLDDRVAEACLAVRPHERTTPWRYKPLLAEALRGVVPERSLARSTKGGTSPEYAALPRYRADLLALCEDSRLAALGLIDVDRLRAELNGVWLSDASPITVEQTVGCERWLRDLESTGFATTLMTGAPG